MLNEVRKELALLSSDDRVRFFEVIEAGWCRWCGDAIEQGTTCPCRNDD
jgi:hypothetical protein